MLVWYYVPLKGRPIPECKRIHTAPAIAARCPGCVAKASGAAHVAEEDCFLGDLFEAVKEAKRVFRKKWRRWRREREWLRGKCDTAAPSFKTYAQEALKKHIAQEPKFTFVYER